MLRASATPVHLAAFPSRMLREDPVAAGRGCAHAWRPQSGRGRRRAVAGQPVMASAVELGGAGP